MGQSAGGIACFIIYYHNEWIGQSESVIPKQAPPPPKKKAASIPVAGLMWWQPWFR